MSMHLEKAWLTTTGKKKGKVKFRNAAEAQRARQLEESWKELQTKWSKEKVQTNRHQPVTPCLPTQGVVYRRDTGPRIPSLNSSNMSPCTKSETKMYTGSLMKGISQTHKSNAVPVFSQEEIIDIRHMRR